MTNVSKPVVLVFHDRNDWPPMFVERLNNNGFKAQLFRKPSECIRRVKKGLGHVDAVLLHKDIGDNVPEEWQSGIDSDVIVQAIHEEAPFVRVGVVSGEYPDGTRHVLGMGADFYVGALEVNDDWTLEQLRKGVVTQEEQARRGVGVEMPNLNSGRERYY